MLTIRFARVGRKNRAQFRIVLQQHTAAPGGRHIAVLGSYDPVQKKAVLKADKIKEWIGKGSQVSDSAYNLFVREGVIEGKKRAVKMERPKAPVAEAPKAEEVKTEEVKAVEEVKTEETKTEEVKA
jgi:small subunit ribosomal protein S16